MVNPAKPSSFTFKTTRGSSGVTYRYIDQVPEGDGPGKGKTVICFHGFPDLSIGWRYQISALVKRGFRVLCPDQIGYGGTDKPDALEPYTFIESAKAMHEILSAAGVKGKPIVLGHDWGAAVAWRYLQLYPNEVECLVNVCVPPFKAAQKGQPFLSTEDVVRNFVPNFGYQLYFGDPSSTPELEANLKFFLGPMFSAKTRRFIASKLKKAAESHGGDGKDIEESAMDQSWVQEGVLQEKVKKANGAFEDMEVDEEEFAFYYDAFKKNGMRGPLTWYKTRKANYDAEIAHKLPKTWTPDVPVLFVAPTGDPALPLEMSPPEMLKSCFPGGNLEKVVVDGDHWLLQDEFQRDAVTKVIVEWVEKQVSKGSTRSRL